MPLARPTSATVTTAPIRTRFAPRCIRFQRVHALPALTLKLYTIMRDAHPLPEDIMQAALAVAAAHQDRPPTPVRAAGIDWHTLPSHGLGSLIVHAGAESLFVLLDVWTDDNMLRHHVWVASPDAPTTFESLDASHLVTCVWELAVLQHERAAWLRHMYRADGGANPVAYLHDTLNVDC